MDSRIFWLSGTLGKLSQHFEAKEFECPCGCKVHTLNIRLVEMLEKLRKKTGPINIHSGFRCVHRNLVVGGARYSQHLTGDGLDISWGGWTGKEMENVAQEFFDSIGVGAKFIHVDLRSGRRRWTYG